MGCCIPLKTLFCCVRGPTPAADEDDSTKVEPKEQRPDQKPRDATKSGRLWKEAYDILCRQDPDLVESYQSALLRVTRESTPDPVAAGVQVVEQHGLTGEELESQLGKAVEAGLERTRDYEETVQATGEVVDAILSIRELITTALSAFPQAAAAWTGVTLVFDGFSNAASESITNREGLVYVGSLVTWYWKLFNQHPDKAPDNDDNLDKLLSEHFVGLCVKLTEYQMRSVLLYYRNWFVRTMRGAFRADQWEEALASIKADESFLQDRLKQFYGEETLTNLKGIRTTINKLWEGMESFTHDHINAVIGQFNLEGLDYNALLEGVDDAEPDTCDWVLDEELLKSWAGGLVVIKALPGQGKSVLARFLVQKWKAGGTVCHFFFNDDSQISKQAANSLCAMLHQLLVQHRYLARVQLLREKIASYGKGLMTSVPQLWDTMTLACGFIDTPVTLVFDALDECAETPDGTTPNGTAPVVASAGGRKDLLRVLSLSPKGNIRILATSRPVSKVNAFLSNAPFISLEDRTQELAAVINKVVHGRIERLAKKHAWKEELKEEIARKLLPDGDQFTFLVIKVVFKALDPEDDELVLTGDQWRALVEKSSQGLGSTYSELLANVNPDLVDQVKALFALMIAAREPLTPAELNTAMEMCRGKPWEPGRQYMPSEAFMTKWIKQNTALMVTIRRGRVHFIHQTAKEFFICTREDGDVVAVAENSWSGLFTPMAGIQSSHWAQFIMENGAHSIMRVACSLFVLGYVEDYVKSARRGKKTAHISVNTIDVPTSGSELSFLRYALANYAFHFDNSVCRNTPTCYFSNGELSYPLGRHPPTSALTSGSAARLVPAAIAQVFARDGLGSNRLGPGGGLRIPEIFAVIKIGPDAHIVSEYIGLALRLEEQAIDSLDSSAAVTRETSYGSLPSLGRILRIFYLFFSLPIPSEMPVGHFSDKETVASTREGPKNIGDEVKRLFHSNRHLQSKLALLLRFWLGGRSRDPQALALRLAKSHFVFTDITVEQFMLGQDDAVYAVDFRSAAILPIGFMTYALSAVDDDFAKKVGQLLTQRLMDEPDDDRFGDPKKVEKAAELLMTRPDLPWWKDGSEKDDRYVSLVLRM